MLLGGSPVSRSRVWILSLLFVVIATSGLSAVALGHTRPRAEIRVTGGSGHVSVKAHKRPVLAAHFTIAHATGGGSAANAVLRFRVRVEFVASSHTVVLKSFARKELEPGRHLVLTVRLALPKNLAKRDWTIEACVSGAGGCRRLGSYDTAPPKAEPVFTTHPTTTTVSTTTPTSTSSTTTWIPTHPLTGYSTNSPYFVSDGRGQYANQANASGATPDSYGGYFTSGYYVVVPPSYDATNSTPETLVVWMHGCDGTAYWDAQALTDMSDSDRPYILISLNGPEGAGGSAGPSCWTPTAQGDVPQVLADITDVETQFNIDRRRVIIAGYSSGGDLAYETIFTHATEFAGILADNTNPVRDNGFGPNGIGTAIAGAAWKFPGIQLSHSEDEVYHLDRCGYSGSPACVDNLDPSGYTDPDVGVRPQITAMDNAGFDMTLTVRSGYHYNEGPSADCQDTASTCTGGEAYDEVHSLLDTIATDGWEAPAS
jgi:predicted esterase